MQAPDEPSSILLPEVSFGKASEAPATERTSTVPPPSEGAIQLNPNMQDGAIERLIAQFEGAVQYDHNGAEFWDSRDLAKLLDYSDYRNFLNIIRKAKDACRNTGVKVEDHFVDATDMIEIGKGAARPVETIKLSRYACYLLAQNGDPGKQPVAFAQTYFAVQTRRQEADDDGVSGFSPLPEDEKRLLLRNEIKEHNKHLASAAKSAGVEAPIDYAIFQTHGYQGLYGLDVPGIRRRKKLKASQQILDHMGSTELAANLFRATQTEDKLRRDKVMGKQAANRTHYEVGQRVRGAIADIGGTMPEDLPPAEDIVKLRRRINKGLANSGKPSAP